MSVPAGGRVPESELVQTHDEPLRVHAAQLHGAQHVACDLLGADDHGLLTASLERLVMRIVGWQETVGLEIGDPVPRFQSHVLADHHTPAQYAGDFDAIGSLDGFDVGDFLYADEFSAAHAATPMLYCSGGMVMIISFSSS